LLKKLIILLFLKTNQVFYHIRLIYYEPVNFQLIIKIQSKKIFELL